MRVGVGDVLRDILRLLVDSRHHRFLLHHESVHILEELGQFDDLPFDLLDGLVSALDGAESRLGLATAVALEEL
jgi:hypothetical protein